MIIMSHIYIAQNANASKRFQEVEKKVLVSFTLIEGIDYTLLKSNVTTWSVGGRCRGSQECGSRFVNFACKFHWRWHAVFGSSHNSEIYNIGARAQ